MYVKAAKLLHDKLLDSVLRGNLRFFDSTPIGRIVNRFSKDVETLEASIPHSVKSIVECFLDMSATLFIISSTTPLFLIALVPIAIFYIFVQVSIFCFVHMRVVRLLSIFDFIAEILHSVE